jgi:predicted PurR-regulated permease PerM
MQTKQNPLPYDKHLKAITLFLGILTTISIGYVMMVTRSFLLPVILAVFIYFILDPLICFFERKRIPTAVSIFLTLLIFVFMFFLLGMMINKSVEAFTNSFPAYEARINTLMTQIETSFDISDNFLSGDWKNDPYLRDIISNFSITGLIRSILGSISNFFSKFTLVMLFLIFILIGRNQFEKKVATAYSTQISSRLIKIIHNVHESIRTYIGMQTLISLATAIIVLIILSIFGMDFVIIWALLTFLLNFIPTVGSIFAVILPVTFAFLQFEDAIMVIWIAIILSIIQFTIGNLLSPKIMGKSMNLSPLVVLFSLLFWGWLWGVIGMFLAVPLTVVIKIIFENIDALHPISVLMGSANNGE